MMRVLFLAALVLLSGPPAAKAQDITYKDLQGHTVTASFVYAQTIKLLEQDGRIINNENRQTMTLKLRPDELIDQNYKVQIVARDGREVGGFSGNLTAQLNKPTRWQHGELLFTLDGNDLVRLQTFDKGGRKITVSLARAKNRFTCKVDAPFAREEGGGTPVSATTSQVGRQKIEVLSVKMVRSNCQVAKTKG